MQKEDTDLQDRQESTDFHGLRVPDPKYPCQGALDEQLAARGLERFFLVRLAGC